jgi:dihydroorotate dehydrogenase
MKNLDWFPRHGWMNAAGTAGFLPDKGLLQKFPGLELFSTNPVSYQKRFPAKSRNLISTPGGFWVHSGFPNPGFNKVIKRYAELWGNAILPICVNLLVNDSSDTQLMINSLDNLENIYAVEISIHPDFPFNQIVEIIDAATSKIPVILSLSPDRLFEFSEFPFQNTSIAAISLQTHRGVVVLNNKPIRGRLYGRNVFPLTLNAVSTIKMLEINLPIFAGSGISSKADVEQLFDFGVYAIQLHELAWAGVGINFPAIS